MLEAKGTGHKFTAAVYAVQHGWEPASPHVAAPPLPIHQGMPVSRIMTGTVTTFAPQTRIEVATAKMLQCGISGAPIVDAAGKPIGIVSTTDLLEAWQQQAEGGAEGASEVEDVQVGDIMVPYLLAVSHRASISLAAALMAYEGVQRLIVLSENNSMVGILSALDMLRWVAQFSGMATLCTPCQPGVATAGRGGGLQAMPHDTNLRVQMQATTVATIMARGALCLAADTPLEGLAELFLERDIGCAPVVDAAWRPVATINKTDLLRRMVEADQFAVASHTVADIAHASTLSLQAGAPIAVAAALLANAGQQRLPIVAPWGEVVGIVSTLDIVRWVAHVTGEEIIAGGGG